MRITIDQFRIVTEGLEHVVNNLPTIFDYIENMDGFVLENDGFKLDYWGSKYDDRVELVLKGADQNIIFYSEFTDMSRLPQSLRCTCVWVHKGEGDKFNFIYNPEDGSYEGNTLLMASIQSAFYELIGQPGIIEAPQEFFDAGSRIMQVAARKYYFAENHKVYVTQGFDTADSGLELITGIPETR